MGGPRQAEQRVLSTLNVDGSRRRLRPRLARGRFHRRRRALAMCLLLIFFALPLVHVGGKPLVLLDLSRRQFTLFGHTFLSSDNLLLMLLVVSLVVTIFLLTALMGRVWCGWACPQTVYMEFLFRPVERLLEGKRRRVGRGRLVLKHGIFALLSLLVAHVFLAYFVPVGELVSFLTRSPAQQPTAFLVMAATAGLVYFDFAYFREQTCIVACPYGRLQAVLLDRRSWIVAYDPTRGEPRGKPKKTKKSGGGAGQEAAPVATGDCIDCGACWRACPTGIDIRDGLQMECLTCAQCVDACDGIMDRLGRAPGLIRYTSQDSLAGQAAGLLRPRVVIYPLLLVAAFVALGLAAGRKDNTDVTLLRGLGSPYSLMDGGARVSGQLRVRIVNRGGSSRKYRLELVKPTGIQVIAPVNPVTVDEGKTETAIVFLIAPRHLFRKGQLVVSLKVSDGQSFERTLTYPLLGPETTKEAQ